MLENVGKLQLEDILMDYANARHRRVLSLEAARQRIVQLDQDEAAHTADQVAGKRTQSRAYLQDLILGAWLDRVGDLPLQILIDEKILPQGLFGSVPLMGPARSGHLFG